VPVPIGVDPDHGFHLKAPILSRAKHASLARPPDEHAEQSEPAPFFTPRRSP